MSKIRFVGLAVAGLVVASCATQSVAPPPAPLEGPGMELAEGLPFAVPQGAQYVALDRRYATLYRINSTCRHIHSLNPEGVVFFWTLEAAARSGHQLSDEEGCR